MAREAERESAALGRWERHPRRPGLAQPARPLSKDRSGETVADAPRGRPPVCGGEPAFASCRSAWEAGARRPIRRTRRDPARPQGRDRALRGRQHRRRRPEAEEKRSGRRLGMRPGQAPRSRTERWRLLSFASLERRLAPAPALLHPVFLLAHDLRGRPRDQGRIRVNPPGLGPRHARRLQAAASLERLSACPNSRAYPWAGFAQLRSHAMAARRISASLARDRYASKAR